MWRILVLILFLKSANSCVVQVQTYGKVCLCNATYCDKAPKVEKLSPGQLQIIFTSEHDPGFNVKGAKFTHSRTADSSVIVDVNSKNTHQKIIGFGGAITDSTGMNFRSVRAPVQKQLMEAFFGEDGLQISLCRIPMGSSFFSERAYTLDDTPGDEDLKKFALQVEDLRYKIPFMQLAQTLTKNELKFFISSWTAPIWMKERQVWGGYSPLKKKYYQTWSDYTVKFLDEYAKHNISYWGLTTGSEPSKGYIRLEQPQFGSMTFTPVDQNIWIRDYLGPTIKKSPYKNIKFMILDDDIKVIPFYLPVILGDNKTIEYIDGVATHWYTDKQISPEVNYMAKTGKKDIFLIMTESSFRMTGPHWGSWDRAGIVADSIIEHMQYDYNGYTYGNLALDTSGQPTMGNPTDASVLVSSEDQMFLKEPYFYVLGHFSKYIRPNSIRIDAKVSTNSRTNITVVAFERPDNLKAVVVFNGGNNAETIQIRDGGKLSDAIQIPGHSLNTILYNK